VLMATKHPEVQWAQSRNELFLKVFIDNPSNVKVDIAEHKLTVSGHSPAGEYSVELELFAAVTQEKSKWATHPRLVDLTLHKAAPAWWTRLLKAEGKAPHFVKVDWSRWKEEEDSDGGGAGGDFDFSADPAEFDDSDDEQETAAAEAPTAVTNTFIFYLFLPKSTILSFNSNFMRGKDT